MPETASRKILRHLWNWGGDEDSYFRCRDFGLPFQAEGQHKQKLLDWVIAERRMTTSVQDQKWKNAEGTEETSAESSHVGWSHPNETVSHTRNGFELYTLWNREPMK